MHLKPTPNHPFYFIVCIKLWSGGKKEDFWLNMQVYEVVVAKMQHLSVKNVWTKTIISVCTSLFLSKWWSSSLGYNTIFQMWIHGKFHQIWQEMVIGSCLLINSSFFFYSRNSMSNNPMYIAFMKVKLQNIDIPCLLKLLKIYLLKWGFF